MKLSDEIVDFIMKGNGNSVVLVATMSEFGVVNLSPRFILDIDNSGPDTKMYFASGLPNKTLYNIRKVSKVGISKWINDVSNSRIVFITGIANNLTSGDKYEEMSNKLMEAFANAGFVKKGEFRVDKPVKPLAVTEVVVDYVKVY